MPSLCSKLRKQCRKVDCSSMYREAGEGPRDQFIMGDETCGQQKKFIVEGSLLLIVDNEWARYVSGKTLSIFSWLLNSCLDYSQDRPPKLWMCWRIIKNLPAFTNPSIMRKLIPSKKERNFFIKCWVFNSRRARLQFCALKWVWKLEPPYHILSKYYLKLSSIESDALFMQRAWTTWHKKCFKFLMKYFLGSCFSHNKLGQGQIQKFDEFEKSEHVCWCRFIQSQKSSRKGCLRSKRRHLANTNSLQNTWNTTQKYCVLFPINISHLL